VTPTLQREVKATWHLLSLYSISESLLDCVNYASEFLLDFALPKPNDFPALGFQSLIVPVVSCFVLLDLGTPEFCVGHRLYVVLRATMPEATINEDENPLPQECEIRPRPFDVCPGSVPQARSPQGTSKADLGCRALGADRPHDLAALLFAERVHDYPYYDGPEVGESGLISGPGRGPVYSTGLEAFRVRIGLWTGLDLRLSTCSPAAEA
jgi:hypothetical protein